MLQECSGRPVERAPPFFIVGVPHGTWESALLPRNIRKNICRFK